MVNSGKGIINQQKVVDAIREHMDNSPSYGGHSTIVPIGLLQAVLDLMEDKDKKLNSMSKLEA